MAETEKPLEQRVEEAKQAVDAIDQEFLRVHKEKGYCSETQEIAKRGLEAIANFILDNPDADSFAKEAVMYRGDNRERFLRFRGDNNDSEHSRDLMWHAVIEKIVEIANARLKATESPKQPEADPSDAAIAQGVQTEVAATLPTEAEVEREQIRLLENAMEYGTQADLEALFDNGMNIDQTDFAGNTSLQIAAYSGKLEIVKMLISRGANVNFIVMYQGRIPLTALDAARESKKKDIVEILLANGAKTGQEIQPREL